MHEETAARVQAKVRGELLPPNALPIVVDVSITGNDHMTRLSQIVDFERSNEECLARLKPGDEMHNYVEPGVWGSSEPDDYSVLEAEARWYHARLGAVLDDGLLPAHWIVDWRDRSAARPTLRLSRDLFAHVADALERA